MKIKKKTLKKSIAVVILLIILLSIFIFLCLKTGIFQASKIDDRDLAYWQYEEGSIKQTNEFSILGSLDTCWILIHSYTATPSEMRELARRINNETENFIFVAKLSGHGEVPSHLAGKNLSTWYEEVEKKYATFGRICDNVNLVGSSFGAILALRLAEEHKVNNLYILNPFASKENFLPFLSTTVFAGPLNYYKKSEIAKINSDEGKAKHIAYWNMPLRPVKNSFPFIKDTISKLDKIQNPVFLAYSENDVVSGSKTAPSIFDKLGSSEKQIKNYKNSNHILLLDYDKDQLMADILEFEKQNSPPTK